jgi:hypothetical protein
MSAALSHTEPLLQRGDESPAPAIPALTGARLPCACGCGLVGLLTAAVRASAPARARFFLLDHGGALLLYPLRVKRPWPPLAIARGDR